MNSELWQAHRKIRDFVDGHVHRCEQLTQEGTMSDANIFDFFPWSNY